MIKEVIVVEGRADEARIRSCRIEADTIRTDGFNLLPHTLEAIRAAYERRGIIILTDPDGAGERIRKYLTDKFPLAKHAFVPRKEAIANDDLGIEQANRDSILRALEQARCLQFEPQHEFTLADLSENGLNGTTDASQRRSFVGAKLGIGYGNAKQFLRRLNSYGVTRDEWNAALAALNEG